MLTNRIRHNDEIDRLARTIVAVVVHDNPLLYNKDKKEGVRFPTADTIARSINIKNSACSSCLAARG